MSHRLDNRLWGFKVFAKKLGHDGRVKAKQWNEPAIWDLVARRGQMWANSRDGPKQRAAIQFERHLGALKFSIG